MIFSACFEPSSKTSARANRRKLKLQVRGNRTAGSDLPVLVHNISATGLLIECDAVLSIKDRIDIDLPHAGTVSAIVVWASGRMFGCQFDLPISLAALSAAQLQGVVEVQLGNALCSDASSSISDTEPKLDFSANMKRLRLAKGLSQSDVAKHLGVSGASISGWEKGRARPKGDRLSSLAELLGVPTISLLEDPQPAIKQNMISDARDQIAHAAGVTSDRIRILIEF